MKIDITERLLSAAASGKPFDVQLAEAKASGNPFGLVSDTKLGRHVIYHTDEEIADAQARTTAEAANPVIDRFEQLEARIAALEGR